MRRRALFRKAVTSCWYGVIYLVLAVIVLLVSARYPVRSVESLVAFCVVLICALAIQMTIKKPLADYLEFAKLDGRKAAKYFAKRQIIRYADEPEYVVDLEEMLCAEFFPEYVDVNVKHGIIAIIARNDGRWRFGWKHPEQNPSTKRIRVVVLESLSGTKILNECHALASRHRNFGYYNGKITVLNYGLRLNGKVIAYCDQNMIAALWDALHCMQLSSSKYLSDVTERVNCEVSAN